MSPAHSSSTPPRHLSLCVRRQGWLGSVMLRFANVDGEKRLPFPKGRGSCPCCGGQLIAKCGQIKTHHWAHESRDDCDTWSEPLGQWHLWWQNLVRPEFVEVAKGVHRADVVGNRGVVVELQHSPISTEDIAAREQHYGDMVWLIDATHRFDYTKSGSRAFFTLGQTKHLDLCSKPVFLDFGLDLVQVERFTDAITMVSGVGLVRSREWFAQEFLSDVQQPGIIAGGLFIPEGGSSNPWDKKSPVWKLKHDTRWMDPTSGRVITFPKWSEYIKVNYYTYRVGDSQNKQWDHDKLIDRHPELANGWTKDGLRQMKEFFAGTAIILGGLLRVLPLPASSIPVNKSVSATERLLSVAEEHIRAGRIPVLKDSTKSGLVEKAKLHEMQTYGRLLQPETQRGGNELQPSLFG